MACYHPLRAFQNAGGVFFSELRKHGDYRIISLPCGQCVGCRLERSRQWAMRCVHEASLYDENEFVTLTYDDNKIPHRGQLHYRDVQLFIKRLRKSSGAKIKYIVCGEYGETTMRPHYHMIIFGYRFPDREKVLKLQSEHKLYSSAILERLWQKGHCVLGEVNFETAAYIARYCIKKVTGKGAEAHYSRVDDLGEYQLTPEFLKMSLKKAIGKAWLEKFHTDVYPHDYVIINGREVKPPKYYDKMLEVKDIFAYEEVKTGRLIEANQRSADNTPERLVVKEKVAKARLNQSKRGLL